MDLLSVFVITFLTVSMFITTMLGDMYVATLLSIALLIVVIVNMIVKKD